MYKNIINLFFFVFLTNTNSFLIKNVLHTRKNVLRLSADRFAEWREWHFGF